MVDLGIVSRNRLMDALLDDSVTGVNGSFPTNLTGGLKGRGHPLGATGMIQIVENHRLIREKGFKAGLSHSIGGPINNNVVTLLECTEQYENRSHERFKPWGMPSLGKMKPKGVNLETLLSLSSTVKGSFVSATVRFHHKTGNPEVVILIAACRFEGTMYKFLFGIPGEYYGQVSESTAGDPISIEKVNGSLLINSMPVTRFYTRTMNGLVELAGSSWRKLTGKV